MTAMNIGDAAAAAGVTPKMIRHYESLGLIPAAERTESGYRLYTAREVAMLRFIRQSRSLGFSIPRIDGLLSQWRDEHRQSRAVKEMALTQLAELEERQRELDAMRATLAGMVEACAGDEQADCAILEGLSLAAAAAQRQAACHRAANGLKQVKAGSAAPRARQPRAAKAAPAPAAAGHAGLMVWSRSFAAAPGA